MALDVSGEAGRHLRRRAQRASALERETRFPSTAEERQGVGAPELHVPVVRPAGRKGVVVLEGFGRAVFLQCERREPHSMLRGLGGQTEPFEICVPRLHIPTLMYTDEPESVPRGRVQRIPPNRLLQAGRSPIELPPAGRAHAPGAWPARVSGRRLCGSIIEGQGLFVAMSEFVGVPELEPGRRVVFSQVGSELRGLALRRAEIAGRSQDPDELPACLDVGRLVGEPLAQKRDGLRFPTGFHEQSRSSARRGAAARGKEQESEGEPSEGARRPHASDATALRAGGTFR